VDKQAAARCWRDGQKKRCFTYRFLATGTVEEKIFQRQLSKEGLQSVVDDKEQVNKLSTKDLRNLFKLRTGTPSDTHDKLKCERCKIIHDDAEMEAKKVLPKKLAACKGLVSKMTEQEDAKHFLTPLNPSDYGVTKEEYEKIVKQPIDLGTVQKRLNLPEDQAQAYKSVSNLSKDVNRIFANVMKVWSPGEDEIADASQRLQAWWVEQWQELVPILMTMKADDDDTEGKKEENGNDPSHVLEGCAFNHNERGDDYQEQIGCPDEEDLNSWSHHHRTDTVDDPVFRAAMRGCDAVSFCFNLEVTWDLIQQRQQEEEEAAALKELEALGQIQEEGEEDEKEENDSITDDDKDKENDGDAQNTTSDQMMELDDSDDEDNAAAEKKDSDAEMVTEEAEDEKSVEATASRSGMPSSSSSDEESLAGSSCSSPRGGTQQAEVLGSPESSSDDSNESGGVTAEIVESSQASDLSPAETATAGWNCSTCTLNNPKAKRKCSACGTVRPSAGATRSGTKRSRQEV
jgi:hypothetical protein